MLSPYLYQKAIELLEQNENANYMEIGSFDGEGIAMLCNKFPERKFYAIEPFIEDGNTSHITGIEKGNDLQIVRESFIKNIKDCTNLQHIEQSTIDYMIISGQNKVKFPDIGILLIDGDHSYDAVQHDLMFAWYLAENHPIIVIMDDINNPGVHKAIKTLLCPITPTTKINEDSLYFTIQR
jgi:hypothetical protein